MKKGVIGLFLLVLVLVSSVAFSGNHEDSKVDAEVIELLKSQDEVSVIVVLEDDESVMDDYSTSSMDNFEMKKMMIKEIQDEVLSGLDYEETLIRSNEFAVTNENIDFKLESKFNIVNGFSGIVTNEGLEKLISDKKVKKIYPNRPIQAFLSDSAGIINATNTWSLIYNSTNLTGKGEVICVIDTGVDYTHESMGGCASTNNINDGSCAKVIGGYDFINNDEDPIDDEGHGTHVTGIIASTNKTNKGIAPDANIIAIKSLGSDGTGSTQNLIDGIDWCVNNASIFNITVISMSLGTTELFTSHCDKSDPLTAAAIDAAIAINISVIAATGNADSNTSIVSPACIKNTTSVGGVNKNDAMDFNRNNVTDLLAPGVSITSLKNGGGVETQSGTSMSTPHVAGAFAIIHQYFKLTENRVVMPNETERYLNDTGKQITDNGVGGSGLTFSRINIFEVIKSLDTTSPIITINSPKNNSARTNLTFFVNISSSEILNNVTMEINNTNFTMAGSGLNWNLNISSLINGTYTYRIYGNDSFGNSNVSDLFTINIDLIPPFWGGNKTNISDINNIKKNDAIQFNITWNDTVALSYFIFSWNDTGLWANLTNGSLNGQSQIVSVNKTVTASRGNVVGYKFYANDTANNYNDTDTFVFSIANTNPSAINITINSSDFLNRTNGTLIGYFSFTDVDGDSITANETKWYNDTEEVLELVNLSTILSSNTTKNEIWVFSVRVFDGFNFSEWVNSTNLTIINTAPEINITISNVTVNETEIVNITINASDLDGDDLTFSINDTLRFGLQGIYFLWNTSLSDNGEFRVNITVNDTVSIDSKIVTVIVYNAFDSDGDGNPDFNDTDDDNDGQDDTIDFLIGNSTNITTNLPTINITINGSIDFSILYNGTFFINISNGSETLLEFNYTFNSTNRLNLLNLTYNRSTNGSARFSIKGLDLKNEKVKKTVYLDKINATVKGVCILDQEADYTSISSACNASNEVLVNCTGVPQNGFICTDLGNRWKIENLTNTAGRESCRDLDGDGYGLACLLGTDCDDNDSSKTTSCGSSSSSSSSGGGGGGGGGGGILSTSAGTTKSHFYTELIAGSTTEMKINRPFIALKKNIFTVINDLTSVTFTVTALDSVNDFVSGNVYQYFEIEKTNIKDEDISSVKLQFEVNNSWFKINEFDKDSVILNRLNVIEGWETLPTKLLNEEDNSTVYEAKSSGYSVFAITAEILKLKIVKAVEEKKIALEEAEETIKVGGKPIIAGAVTKELVSRSLLAGSITTIITVIGGFIVYSRFFRNKKKTK